MSESKAMPDWPVPRSWNRVRIGDVLSLVNGFAFKPSHWKKEGLPIVRIQNLNNQEAPYNYCTDSIPEKFRVEHGDLLFAWSGTPGTSFGAHIWRGGSAWLNQHIFRIDFSEKLFDRRFLRLAINANLADYIASAHGGAGLAHITIGKFRNSVLLLAPFNEQARIVAEIEKQFTRLDAAVAALKRVQANLKRYRAAVLKAACEGRLVPTEAELARKEGRTYETGEQLLARILKQRRAKWEADQLAKMQLGGKLPKNVDWKRTYKEPGLPDAIDLTALPAGWVWARAEQICDFITKGTTPSSDKLFEGSGDVPFIKVYNLTNRGALDFTVNPTFIGKATHTRELARSLVRPGDVLMNIVGPPLGKVSIVPNLFPEWNVNQAIAIFRPVPGVDRRYLAALLLCDDILRWAIRRAKATAGQFNLTLEICRDLPLPLPPVDEQARIVEALDACLSAAESSEHTLETNVQRSDRLRQSILKRAFEGKLVPQNPNDEPASRLLERIQAEKASRKTQGPLSQSRKRRQDVASLEVQ